MNKWLCAYLQSEILRDNINYRKNVTENFILFFTFLVLFFYTAAYLYNADAPLFDADGLLLMVFPLIVLFFKNKKNIVTHITLLMIGICLLYIIHINKIQHYLPIWSFAYIYASMVLCGHQKSSILAIIYYFVILSMLYRWVGHSLNITGFIHFSAVAILSISIFYICQYVIAKALDKLSATQKKRVKIKAKIKINDPLTGLYSRAHFDCIVNNQINATKRDKTLLALAIFDIDYFQAFKDNYGEPAGDQALIKISKLLRSKFRRATDIIFRLAEGEFALLFKVQNEQEAFTMTELVRNAVEQLKIAHSSSRIFPYLTLSCGLEVITAEHDRNDQQVYQLCESLLSQAKQAGRNQTSYSCNLQLIHPAKSAIIE